MILVISIFAVYLQAGNHQFINFDDNEYVTKNAHIANGLTCNNIIWAFTSVEAANWHPITWLSHMADVQLYGMNPRGHHLTSVLIHTISTILLLLFLYRYTGSLLQSTFVAALFALHPLHVESVAWVAERKDVLSAFFWILTLMCYCKYVMKRKRSQYILSLFFFVLGLMSKPMLVTLPVILILMDFWPLDRYGQNDRKQGAHQLLGKVKDSLNDKIPFFVLSFLSAAVTVYAQKKGDTINSIAAFPVGFRIENALVAYVKYIIKTFWPHDLAVFYPLSSSIPLWQPVSSLLVLLLVSAAAVRVRRQHPYLMTGWFWFLVTLVPVIGLVQVGSQSMADRYTYIPAIGLFIMVAWGVPTVVRGLRYRDSILALTAAAVIVASAALTWKQLGYWQDDISLFRHTLQVTTGNYEIHNNLGNALINKGDLDAAIREFSTAISISPYSDKLHTNLGITLALKGNTEAAIEEYKKALEINANYADAHFYLGNALFKKGNLDGAIYEYRETLRIDPNGAEKHYNLGTVLNRKGNLDAAIHEFQEVLRINPNDADAHTNLGFTFINKGNLNAAIREFQEVVRIAPHDAKTHINLGAAYAQKGDLNSAIKEFQTVLRISPDDAKAQSYLGIALAQRKRKSEERH